MSDLTAEEVRELLDYEPETGVFRWRITTSSRAVAGSVAGSPNGDGYLQIRVQGKLCYSHRLAWLISTGAWPSGEIDHRNGVKADNRLANLRDVARTGNQQNIRNALRNSTTGLLGSSPARGKFRAAINLNKKHVHLGYFNTAEQAHAAYLAAKRRLHEFGTL